MANVKEAGGRETSHSPEKNQSSKDRSAQAERSKEPRQAIQVDKAGQREKTQNAEHARAEKTLTNQRDRAKEIAKNQRGIESSRSQNNEKSTKSASHSPEARQAGITKANQRNGSHTPEKKTATPNSKALNSEQDKNKRLAEKQQQLEKFAEAVAKNRGEYSKDNLIDLFKNVEGDSLKVIYEKFADHTKTTVRHGDSSTRDFVEVIRIENTIKHTSELQITTHNGKTDRTSVTFTDQQGRQSHFSLPNKSSQLVSHNPDRPYTINNTSSRAAPTGRPEKSPQTNAATERQQPPEPPRVEQTPSERAERRSQPDRLGKVDQYTIDFIKTAEGNGLRGKPFEKYNDSAGKATQGYGHLLLPGENFGKKMTKEKAEELLAADLQMAVKAINQFVKVPLTPRQRTALTSFIFNLGTSRFKGSTLLELLNKKDYVGAAEQISRWDKVTPKGEKPRSEPGLATRRAKERNNFEEGIVFDVRDRRQAK